ncbi:PAS domain S-box protein [Piscinibacter aquaticus]|uniref:histidine kinase n=1 Tax=Piscinibacter aquaticus TaxID=392597 RepID=A0A5C6U360_9BURK|nr:PAS domain S-box protein [Piscinibacter aquaticus]
MLALLAAVMLAAMAALYFVSTQRAAAAALQSSSQWAGALARTAAGAAAPLMVRSDQVALEKALRDIARLPGVLRIDVRDSAGVGLMSVRAVRWQRGGAQPPAGHAPPAGRCAAQRRAGAGGRHRRTAGVDAGRPDHAARPHRRAVQPGRRARAADQPAARADRLDRAGRPVDDRRGVRLPGAFARAAAAPGALLAWPRRRAGPHARGAWRQPRGGRTHRRPEPHLADAAAAAAVDPRQRDARALAARRHARRYPRPDREARVAMINPAATSIFGVEPEQVLGKPVEQLLPQLSFDEVDRITREGMLIRASRMARLESSALRRDGTQFPVEVAISRVGEGEDTRFTCVVRDVTDQRWIDSMLRLYNRALECATNGVVISDLRTPGHPIFYANPAFEKITGYEVSDAIGRPFDFLLGEDRDQPEVEVLRRAVREGQPTTVVLRNYRKDGTLFFNELSIAPVATPEGEVTHYVGVQSDVTERERARFALAERSARLNAVFDLSPDGFVVFDREGQMVYCNPAFVQMTGWDASLPCDLESFDRRFGTLCNPAQDYAPVAAAAGEAGTHADTIELIRPERRVLARLARLNLGGHGESILYFRDVTHETEVDRMKSEFLTTAAHELRTPMASIFGFAELMLKRPVPPERQRDVLETIHRRLAADQHGQRAARPRAHRSAPGQGLPHHRACAGRTGAGDGGRADDPRRSAQGGGAHRARRAAPDGRLGQDTPGHHQRAVQRLQVFAGGGPIRLHTLTAEFDGRPHVGVAVTDSGIGMTPAQKARLFERFYRADPSGNIPGTGLGMSLVQEIMELQDGRIDVDSEPGIGTRVTLWFPWAEVARPTAAATA